MIRISATDADWEKIKSVSFEQSDQLNDHYDYSNLVVNKPWGYEYLMFESPHVAVWILFLKKDQQTSMHCHPNKTTSLIVLQGEVNFFTLDTCHVFSAGSGASIDKGVFHQTRAVSAKGAFVMEVESPVNKRDLVRLKDAYGREGQGYEPDSHYTRNLHNYNYFSFKKPYVYHNIKKKFDECSVSLAILNETISISELENSDTVIFSKAESTSHFIKIGSALKVDELRKLEAIEERRDLEAIIVRKCDDSIKCSDFILKVLKKLGIHEAFAVAGDANVHLLDSLARDETFSLNFFQLERGAAFAAEAYGRLNNHPALLVVSSGASGTNALTGIAQAWVDSVPLVVVSGQARSDQGNDGSIRQRGNKSLDIVEMVKGICKYAVKLQSPVELGYELSKAFALAVSGRFGPVWIDIPIDILGQVHSEKILWNFPRPRPALSLQVLCPMEQVLARLRRAEKPVVLLGHGVRSAGAQEKALALVAELHAPVMTSRLGADLIADECPYFFGRPGAYGQRRSNHIIQKSDLLLCLGSRLAIPLVGRNSQNFAPHAFKIVVDIDQGELSKNTIEVNLPILSDVGIFIESLLVALRQGELRRAPYASWLAECQEITAQYPVLEPDYRHSSHINPYLFVKTLSAQLKEAAIIVADGCAVLQSVMQMFAFKNAQRLIAASGIELPGFAINSAIGVCVAAGRRPTLCLCESLGFHNATEELITISAENLPIKIVVMMNRSFSHVRRIQDDHFNSRYVGTNRDLNAWISSCSNFYGLPVTSLDSPINLAERLRERCESPGPEIILVKVDADRELIPRSVFVPQDSGRWHAESLDQMYPAYSPRTADKLKEGGNEKY